jgi:hypothetical protein
MKVLKFPDGKIAVTDGMRVEVNRQRPILEEKVNKEEYQRLFKKPLKFKFSKRAKKVVEEHAIIKKRN